MASDPAANVPGLDSGSLPAGPMPGGLNRLQGHKVADIQIQVALQAVEHPEWLAALLPQKVHDPLDKHKVRQSIQALYNTGRFSEIEVEAQSNPAGEVVLVFNAGQNFFLGSILVEGAPDPPTSIQLVNASKLSLGEQFSEDKIQAAMQGMLRTLEAGGYYRAEIRPSYEWMARDQQANILFVVNKGRRARVGRVTITGSPGLEDRLVLKIAKVQPGNLVSQERVNRALQRLRKKYEKQDRIEAQAALTKREYHPENNTLDYTFDIVRGPVVAVKVEGASLPKSAIKKYVPIYEENAVDDDLLHEGQLNLRGYLQSQGYYDAQVEVSQEQAGADRRGVLFDVDRGKRHKLAEIAIEGNRYFPAETLRERMEIQRAGGLSRYGLFGPAMLSRDASSIENLYRGNGFLQAKVISEVLDDYRKEDHVKVTLHIDEGPQTRVGKLAIEGNSAIPTGQLLDRVSMTEGQPFSDASITTDQTQVTSYYFNRGFPNVKFEPSAQPEAGNPALMDVTYKITEGEEVYIDKILISGLHYTRGPVVDRSIAVCSGCPLSQDQMIESQRQLYDLGIFNAVDMAVQNPEGAATHKNVAFQLTEAKRYTFNYGLGFEVATGQPAGSLSPQGQTGASARVSFDITRLNFRGSDHTLTLQTRYGNLQKRALVSYEAPRWFDFKRLTLNLTAFYDDTFDIRTFEARRLEGSTEIKQSLHKGTTLLYRFTYRRVDIPAGSLVIDPHLVPLFSQPVRVGLPSFTYIRDTRDDPTDSHKGAFSTLDAGAASGIFGSQANFGRLLAENSTYHEFHKKRWVFARSTRIGVEQPFRSTDLIPLPELFFAGGSNSDRGFGINQAGPRDLQTGFPLGGEALFLNNLELRTPPLPLPFVGNNLGLVVFHDMGNVFATPGKAVNSFFTYAQPNRDACSNLAPPLGCNFNYMSHAVGSGVRYRTPIGPVSVDLGYNLNPPAFPIAEQQRVDVLKHLNFYIGIGQTF